MEKIKIGIVLFSNMRYSPYYQLYTKICDTIDAGYDLIYFDRYPELCEKNDDSHIGIQWKKFKIGKESLFEKIYNFLSFRIQVRKILKQKKYDKVIILTTIPAVLLSSVLTKKYRDSYLIDIRDYTLEKYFFFKRIEKKVLKKSICNIISSPGYTNFLPDGEYCVCHNMDSNISDDNISKYRLIKNGNGDRIVISYIGSIQYADQCKKMIDLVDQDARFEFKLYGNEVKGTEISSYVKEKNNPRITMMGRFLPQDKPEIYAQSDLVFNCYGNGVPLLDYALSNKLYDGAIYRKPLLVSPNTLMSEMCGEYGFAIDFEKQRNLDDVFSWYQSLDGKQFDKYAEDLLQNSVQTNSASVNAIRESLMR